MIDIFRTRTYRNLRATVQLEIRSSKLCTAHPGSALFQLYHSSGKFCQSCLLWCSVLPFIYYCCTYFLFAYHFFPCQMRIRTNTNITNLKVRCVKYKPASFRVDQYSDATAITLAFCSILESSKRHNQLFNCLLHIKLFLWLLQRLVYTAAQVFPKTLSFLNCTTNAKTVL